MNVHAHLNITRNFQLCVTYVDKKRKRGRQILFTAYKFSRYLFTAYMTCNQRSRPVTDRRRTFGWPLAVSSRFSPHGGIRPVTGTSRRGTGPGVFVCGRDPLVSPGRDYATARCPRGRVVGSSCLFSTQNRLCKRLFFR